MLTLTYFKFPVIRQGNYEVVIYIQGHIKPKYGYVF